MQHQYQAKTSTPSRPPTTMRRSVSVSSFSSDEDKRKDPANIGRLKYSLSFDPPTNQVLLEILKAKVKQAIQWEQNQRTCFMTRT